MHHQPDTAHCQGRRGPGKAPWGFVEPSPTPVQEQCFPETAIIITVRAMGRAEAPRPPAPVSPKE